MLVGSDADMTDRLEDLLRDAVKRRMVADVPVGAFLSGGIDSSTVVALMKAANAGPVRTYTIGFESSGYDEAAHAAAVAKHLGTDHTEMILARKMRWMSFRACRNITMSLSPTPRKSRPTSFPR